MTAFGKTAHYADRTDLPPVRHAGPGAAVASRILRHRGPGASADVPRPGHQEGGPPIGGAALWSIWRGAFAT